MSLTYINYNERAYEWWKVNLSKRILLRKVAVYVRNDTGCGPELYDCCKYNYTKFNSYQN